MECIVTPKLNCIYSKVMVVTRSPGLRAWAALAVLTLAVTLLAIDSTVLALAIPR